MTDPHAGLADLIAVVRAEALALGRDDLAMLLPAPPGPREALSRPRIMVSGSAGRGKSRLINSLLGRPGLSPVGDAPTTGGWLEFQYGAGDAATALLTDPADPGTPRRRPIELAELPRYVSLAQVTAPVLAVEVRLDAPILREVVLVDTPGVAGPQAALRHADAVLFVSDATEPIPESELSFLSAVAQRVETIAVAVNKSDAPGYDDVLTETRRRLAAQPDLARLPVFAVSARLAEQAGRPGTPWATATRLIELAGTRQLMDLLLYDAAATSRRTRASSHAHVTAAVVRGLLQHVDQLTGPVDRIDADIATTATLLDGGGLLGARFEEARHAAARRFAANADALRERQLALADHASAEQLDGVPPRLVIGLAMAGTIALDQTERGVLDAVRDSLRDEALIPAPAELELRLRVPSPPARPAAGATGPVARSLDLLPTLTGLLTGSALMLSVLTGSGAVAADVVLAACAGWWRLRGADEARRRLLTATWIEAAIGEAETAFDQELRRRVHAARQYVAEALPRLLEARLDRLKRMRADRSGAARAETARATLAQVLDELSRRSAAQ